MAFVNPGRPRTDHPERLLGMYRARAREQYPNLMPEVLAKYLVIERGLVLSEADIVEILTTRDARQRARGAASSACDELSWGAIIKAVMKLLGF